MGFRVGRVMNFWFFYSEGFFVVDVGFRVGFTICSLNIGLEKIWARGQRGAEIMNGWFQEFTAAGV